MSHCHFLTLSLSTHNFPVLVYENSECYSGRLWPILQAEFALKSRILWNEQNFAKRAEMSRISPKSAEVLAEFSKLPKLLAEMSKFVRTVMKPNAKRAEMSKISPKSAEVLAEFSKLPEFLAELSKTLWEQSWTWKSGVTKKERWPKWRGLFFLVENCISRPALESSSTKPLGGLGFVIRGATNLHKI